MYRLTLAALALMMAGGCAGSDATAPTTSVLRPAIAPIADRTTEGSPFTLIPYEKWITAYPSMFGNANGSAGAFTGTILQRIISPADPKIIFLQAEYVITDPQRRGHSFTAVVEGDESLHTNTAVLVGTVTDGWKRGSPVRVEFDVLTPCTVSSAPATVKTCFRGTIHILSRNEMDDET